MHPNAIRGMISAIMIDFAIPILQTKNMIETVRMMATIAKREQSTETKNFTMHGIKPVTIKEQQEYIVSSIPGVGAGLARPLLEKLGSVKAIVNADVNMLKQVDLIGDIKAEKIRKVLDSLYE